VRAETRHSLKEDRFSRATINAAERTVHWTVEHQKRLIIASAAVVVLIAAAVGIWYYLQQQDQKASVELGKAVRTMEAGIRPAGAPAQPDVQSFTSLKERATEARKQFDAVIAQYPHTRASDFARYFAGITASSLDDNANAEKNLKEVASVHNADLAALAKFALASVYRKTNRDKDAIELYKQLMDKPTTSVGKATAQMELADLYQQKQQPQEAKRIYEQVQKENPNSEIAQLAQQKLGGLK
jgi:tetratricopeptide (TPR) repeat protein